ncbi:unnamed protein product [Auanema sp. JU1783]|nr:unnamed protein product [Auanema sp. JU1783]
MFKLTCRSQNYAWGKLAADSEVAKITRNGNHSDVDDSKPYAELWMGVHPNGPSMVQGTDSLLSDLIAKNSEMVGEHEQGTLQFLFKVLSVRTALSVQTHPTKEQAAKLHASDPKNYPDANHKPEMAIALTEFQLLCGFRPANEIEENLKDTPEILSLLGEKSSLLESFSLNPQHEQESALKEIFTKIWSSDPSEISEAVAKLVERVKAKENKTSIDNLIIRLDEEFPGGDVGVFTPYLLNYFTLAPGQATFLGPNRPHAYLLGDCIECMACSDNTIRAGLTPKFKDIKTLCENTEYKMGPPPYFFDCTFPSEGGRLYNPPVPEFAVEELSSSRKMFCPDGSSSITIIVNGSGRFKSDGHEIAIQEGDVVFISAKLSQVEITDSSPDFLAFRAFTPL